MNKILFISFLCFVLSNMLFGQADLVLSSASFEEPTIQRGALFSAEVIVQNRGTTASPPSYVAISISRALQPDEEIGVTRVSLKGLEPSALDTIQLSYPISSSFDLGTYTVSVEVDPLDEVEEEDEDNIFCIEQNGNCKTLTIVGPTQYSNNYTYPIIFVHGLGGSSLTWEQFTSEAKRFYGWSYGGRLDYCLNPDGNQSTSDGFVRPFIDSSQTRAGDYYEVNFDVSATGELYVGNDNVLLNNDYSNQSAIVKQGLAMQDAIRRVLELTGSKKVVLVGHSMGGLASREYLQNDTLWQADGAHHVAKLLTIGTPNGGSNAGIGGLSIIVGTDEFSEAVRDLRYPNIIFGGQYLFGGRESRFSAFRNEDVNCNGIERDLITGLNEKAAPSNVNYACIVSSGDGIVAEDRADLNNYLLSDPPLSQLSADRYNASSFHTNIHVENHPILMRGLDESELYTSAYPIPLGSMFFGYTTTQPIGSNTTAVEALFDKDIYSVDIEEKGVLDISFQNIPVRSFTVKLLDENLATIEEAASLGNTAVSFSETVDAGTYFIECIGIATEDSWRFPYAYQTAFTPTPDTLLANFESNIRTGCSPLTVNFSDLSEGEPATYIWNFEGGTPAQSTLKNPTVTYEESGVYSASLTVINGSDIDSITKEDLITVWSVPVPDFSFAAQGDSVIFINQTILSDLPTRYSWDLGDSQSSIDEAPLHLYTIRDSYEVKLTATNACGASTVSKTVDLRTVSTTPNASALRVSASPNPTNGMIHVTVSGAQTSEYNYILLNSLGQLIHQTNSKKNATHFSIDIDMSTFAPGMYYLVVQSADSQHIEKVIKQ